MIKGHKKTHKNKRENASIFVDGAWPSDPMGKVKQESSGYFAGEYFSCKEKILGKINPREVNQWMRPTQILSQRYVGIRVSCKNKQSSTSKLCQFSLCRVAQWKSNVKPLYPFSNTVDLSVPSCSPTLPAKQCHLLMAVTPWAHSALPAALVPCAKSRICSAEGGTRSDCSPCLFLGCVQLWLTLNINLIIYNTVVFNHFTLLVA